MGRVASGLSDNDSHFQEFRDILLNMRFMPAGRIQAAIGSPKHITPYNCYVAGTIHDSFAHGDEAGQNSIMDIAKQAAQTMRMGGGIGYDWSTLRPSGDLIRGVQSKTDGPLAFMPIMDAVCKATSSAGNRRGAQMGVLRIDHPDIFNYIRAKQPSEELQHLWDLVDSLPAEYPGRLKIVNALQKTLLLTGFNLSIALTDEFMECLQANKPFDLKFNGRVFNTVDPQALWETVMRSTWDWAEPGVLFIDTINNMNNLYYCEKIAATNPCGEQPLPPHGACLLGSFNLAKYVERRTEDGEAFEPPFVFNMSQLKRDIPAVVRSMDNVVDRALYPLPAQEQEAKAKRRMGLGVTGLANAAEALGYPYGSANFLQFERTVLLAIKEGTYHASMELASEKGAFPLYDETLYPAGKFIQTLSPELRKDIQKHGIRNSHLTSIAPTGTISYAADNISSGLEPVFMYEGQRKMKTLEGDVIVDVSDYGVREFGVRGRTSDKVTAEEHVEVLAVASLQVDSAVSKTCNVPPTMAWNDFKNIYVSAYDKGCKGCTTFNPGGKRLGIFIAKKKKEEAEEGLACTFDPETGIRNCE